MFVFDNYLKQKNSEKNIILLGLIGIGNFLILYFENKKGSFYIIFHLFFTYFLTKSQLNSIKNKEKNKNYVSYFYNIFFSLIFGILFGLNFDFFLIIFLCFASLFLNVVLAFYNKINQTNKKYSYYNSILIILINMFFNNIFFNELNNIFDIIGTILIFSIYYYDDLIKKIKTE